MSRQASNLKGFGGSWVSLPGTTQDLLWSTCQVFCLMLSSGSNCDEHNAILPHTKSSCKVTHSWSHAEEEVKRRKTIILAGDWEVCEVRGEGANEKASLPERTLEPSLDWWVRLQKTKAQPGIDMTWGPVGGCQREKLAEIKVTG